MNKTLRSNGVVLLNPEKNLSQTKTIIKRPFNYLEPFPLKTFYLLLSIFFFFSGLTTLRETRPGNRERGTNIESNKCTASEYGVGLGVSWNCKGYGTWGRYKTRNKALGRDFNNYRDTMYSYKTKLQFIPSTGMLLNDADEKV